MAVEQGAPEVDADPLEAVVTKLKLKPLIIIKQITLHTPQNLTKRVTGTLMGLQIRPALAIGQPDEARPTVPTLSTAAGPASLHQENLITVEKSARLE